MSLDSADGTRSENITTNFLTILRNLIFLLCSFRELDKKLGCPHSIKRMLQDLKLIFLSHSLLEVFFHRVGVFLLLFCQSIVCFCFSKAGVQTTGMKGILKEKTNNCNCYSGAKLPRGKQRYCRPCWGFPGYIYYIWFVLAKSPTG